MAERAPKSFEKSMEHYARLVEQTPVARTALLSALTSMKNAGEREVKAETIGTVRYASVMVARYAGALQLNAQGLVEPPFLSSHIATITNTADTLSVFSQGNGGTGEAGPTDPNEIQTDGRK